MSLAKRLIRYYEQALIWARGRKNTHSASSLHLFCCKTCWILMISIYQEPQISFKAFSSNLFSSSFFFFSPLWINKKTHNPEGFKSESRQDCEVSFFWKTTVPARLERDRSDTKRGERKKKKTIQIYLQINILHSFWIAGWDQPSTQEPWAVQGCHLLEWAALMPEHPPEIGLDLLF